jgi:hypothetical protein
LGGATIVYENAGKWFAYAGYPIAGSISKRSDVEILW